QRDEAQANFRKAREAVDKYFTLVSEEQLLDMPMLRKFRKSLLDTALGAYKEFLSQKGDDPLVLADLSATHFRVAQINYWIGLPEHEWLPDLEKAVEILERLIQEGRDSLEVQQRFAGAFRMDIEPTAESAPPAARSYDPLTNQRLLEKEAAAYEKFARENP